MSTKKVTMIFLAGRVASNIVFQGELDDAIPLTAFLSAVHSEGSMFLSQRRPVRKSFHQQVRNGTVNPNTPLSALGGVTGFLEPNEHIVLNILKFTPPLDTDGSVASFLFVIRRYFQEFISRLKQ
jgi:hypothetical protein